LLALAGCVDSGEGDIGLRAPYSFPSQTIESVLPLGGGRLLLLNNNYPLSAGRNPEQSDYTEAIIIRPEALGDAVMPAARHRRVLAQDDGRSYAPSGDGHPPSRRPDVLAWERGNALKATTGC